MALSIPLIRVELEPLVRQRFYGVPVWPFALLGAYITSSRAISFGLRFLRQLKTRLFYFDNFRGLGQWAVVTGASDGIGQAYAEQLAKKGMNVVLISRTEAKVAAVAKQLQIDNPTVQIRWIAADFADSEIYDRIEKELKDLDIGVLVNNVGMVCDDIQYYWETSRNFVKNMINVNVMSMLMMTHIIMPRMAAKNRGLIINVASVAGQLPPYFFVMYGTTKSYMKRFTYALQLECERAASGVIVQDLSPYFVATKLARKKDKSNFLVPQPSSYVAGALRTIGLESTHGNVSHELQNFFLSLLPKFVHDFLIIRGMENYRKLAIKMKAKAAADRDKGK